MTDASSLLAASLGRFRAPPPSHGAAGLVGLVAPPTSSSVVLEGMSVPREARPGLAPLPTDLMQIDGPSVPKHPRRNPAPRPRGRWVSQTAGSARARKEAEVSAAEPAAGQIQSVRLSASGHLPTRRGRASKRLEPLDTTASTGFDVDGRTTIYTATQRDRAEIVDQMRTEMQCMNADMRAEMRSEMESLRQELEAKNEQVRELLRHVSRLKAEPEPEPEPEPERPSTEAMLLQMLDDGEEPGEPSGNSILPTCQPFVFPTETDTAEGKQAKTAALSDEPSAQVLARAEMEADRDLNQELGMRSIAIELLDNALDRMDPWDLPETAAQLAENEPPVMREFAHELLDTVMVERMGLPEMDTSDFREMAQELLGYAIDSAVDKRTHHIVGVLPTCASSKDAPQDEEGVDGVDVRAVVGELLDVAIERICILPDQGSRLLTTELGSNALEKFDLAENIEEVDVQQGAVQAAPEADNEADELGSTDDGTSLQIAHEFAVELVALAMERMDLLQVEATTADEGEDGVGAEPTAPAAQDLPETAAQLAENEPPVMREFAHELLDTVMVERMGLPEMDTSDFQEMAQELLGYAIDSAVDKRTHHIVGVLPTCASSKDAPQDEEGVDGVDVNANSNLEEAVEAAPAVNGELPDDVDLHDEAVTKKQMVKKTVQLS